MPDITFYSGRTDCSTSPTTDETFDFPDGSLDRTELLDYFTNHFGYTTDEVVALMGAHTMGRNRISNSGYRQVFSKVKLSLVILTTFEFFRQKVNLHFLKMEHFKVSEN